VNKQNNNNIKKIGGWSWYWLTSPFIFVMFWVISGEAIIPLLFSLAGALILAIQSPFLKVVEVSPSQILIRRNNRFAKPMYKFQTSEIKSATTMLPPTFGGMFRMSASGYYRKWLIFYMKDGRKVEIFLGVFIRRHALVKELRKYVEVLDANFWDR
jgi:hypothetical protein